MASSRFILGVVASGGFHVLAFLEMSHAKASASHAPPPSPIEIETAPPPPPPPPAPAPEPSTKAELAAPRAEKVAAKAAAPPPAAQAGKVLAAKEDAPSGLADFTMVQGEGATYAGGVTTSAGTSRIAGKGGGAPAPVISSNGGGGGERRSGAGDLSKPARAMGESWDCSALFPSSANVDNATVVIVVRVRANGTAETVTVVSDPGQGFGPAARACAMRQRYTAAEDREGRAVAASTAPFRVRFTR